MSKGNKILIVILAAAFLLRFIPSLILHYPIENDASQYNDIGWQLADKSSYSREGITPTIIRPPGYPVFLALVYSIFGHNTQVVIFLQILISTLAVYLVYLIAELIWQKKTQSLIAAGLAAIYPIFIYYNLFLYSENFALLACLLFIYFLFKVLASGGKSYYFLLSGLFFVALMLTKPLFAPILILPIILLILYRKQVKISRALVLFLLPVLLLWGGWIARNYLVFSKPIPFGIGLGPIIYVGNNLAYNAVWPGYEEINKVVPANLSAMEYDDFLKKLALEEIKQNPGAAVKLFFIKAGKYLSVLRDISQNVLYKRAIGDSLVLNAIFSAIFIFIKFFKIIISLFFIFGVFWAVKELLVKRKNYFIVFLALIAMYGLIAHAALYVDERYHLVTFPLHLIIAVYAINGLLKYCQSKKNVLG